MSKRFYYDEFLEEIYDEQIGDYPSNQSICGILNQQSERIAELEEQLKNAIMLPIEIGDKCWTINCWCEYGDAKKGEPYAVTRYELHENIVSGYDIYKSMINNNLTLNVVPRAKTNYKGVQPYLFATKAEAEAKLRELTAKNV